MWRLLVALCASVLTALLYGAPALAGDPFTPGAGSGGGQAGASSSAGSGYDGDDPFDQSRSGQDEPGGAGGAPGSQTDLAEDEGAPAGAGAHGDLQTGGDRLPHTGSSINPWVVAGYALIAAGAALLVAGACFERRPPRACRGRYVPRHGYRA